MALMYDSVNASAIPADAPVVAGYINGKYAWKAADWARFGPNTLKVRIQIFIPGRGVTNDGDVLDVEESDAGTLEAQTQASLWCSMRRSVGVTPCLYTSRSSQAPLGSLITGPINWWLADYLDPPTPHLVPGTVATQYAVPPDTGGDYDLSMTNGVWPGTLSDMPLAKPACQIIGTKTGLGYWIFAQDGGVFAYGDAGSFGSYPGLVNAGKAGPLAAPIVSAAITPTGQGYWLLGADGGVFGFGDARFYGTPA